ncbi:hypothetical protein NC652_013965 [Populus alba x Populus x berolinensis]|nr:hypothetical protein NC652_013965 [Populus alba x Populus x berolinensis]
MHRFFLASENFHGHENIKPRFLVAGILLKILTKHVRKEKYPVVAAFQLLEQYLFNRRRQDARHVKPSVQAWKLRSISQLARIAMVRTQGSSG